MKKKSKKNKNKRKKIKKKAIKKVRKKTFKKKKFKRTRNKIKTKTKLKKIKRKTLSKKASFTILTTLRLIDKFKENFNFQFNIDQTLQKFFQNISNKINNKIDNIQNIIEEEKLRKKELRIKEMHREKIEKIKNTKIEKQLALEAKEKEVRDEIKLVKERKKEIQSFIRIEQLAVRREQAEKQRKFLEQIKLEKKIEQFRKREALEIKNLEKFVLSQERESYEGVHDRIDIIKQKYQALRDQKIRERIQELGIQTTDSDTRADLLEKERQYNFDRQKIEFALESYYRSCVSCVYALNKKWIPKKMSLLRVLDYRFEDSSIYIKYDEDPDEKWLMLIYIKDNNPDQGIIVEDKTNFEKNISIEYKTNEIFKFSDALVDSLTNLLDREIKKRKSN